MSDGARDFSAFLFETAQRQHPGSLPGDATSVDDGGGGGGGAGAAAAGASCARAEEEQEDQLQQTVAVAVEPDDATAAGAHVVAAPLAHDDSCGQ